MLIINRYAALIGQLIEGKVRRAQEIEPPSCLFLLVESAFLHVFRKPKRSAKNSYRALLIGSPGKICFIEDQQGIAMGLRGFFKLVAGGIPAFGKAFFLTHRVAVA